MVAIRTPRRTDDGFYVSRVTWTCDARVQIETFEPNAASSFEVAGAGIQLHNLEGDFYVNGCRLLFGEAIAMVEAAPSTLSSRYFGLRLL